MDLRDEFLRAYQAHKGKGEAPLRTSTEPLRDWDEALPIALLNQKGGCGKTTTAINLSAALAEMGYGVLLIDLDPQAHATLGLGLSGDSLELTVYHLLMRPGLSITQVLHPTHHRNFKLLPANGLLSAAQVELLQMPDRQMLLKKKISEIKALFHFIIMDCPPSLNILTLNALAAASELIIPVQTQYYSLDGVRELFKSIELVRENSNPNLEILGILPTLYDGRTKINRAMLSALQGYFKDQLFETVIRQNAALAESPMMGQPVTQYAPGSRGSSDYRQFAEEVIARVSKATRSVRHLKETV